jgi:hypothetical protein
MNKEMDGKISCTIQPSIYEGCGKCKKNVYNKDENMIVNDIKYCNECGPKKMDELVISALKMMRNERYLNKMY